MPTLAERLLTDENRPRLIADCAEVVEAEVASKKGFTGVAVKAAFATIKAVKRGIVQELVGALIGDFVAKLEPFYQRQQAEGAAIETFAVREADPIADALLEITDARAERTTHKSLAKIYYKLRPQGKQQVVAAMPRIGAMLARHGI